MKKDEIINDNLDDSLLKAKKFIGEERLSRRNTLPHLSFSTTSESSVDTQRRTSHQGHRPSIFDQVGDDEGLEALLFTSSSSSSNGHLRRDMSMSPFSRIRNDLEAFVESSDHDIESRLLDTKHHQLQLTINNPSGSVPNSPLISNVVSSEGGFCTVWVGNLDHEATEEVLYEMFDQVAPVQSLKLYDGYAFFRFEYPEEAAKVVDVLNGSVVGRSVIKVAPGKDDHHFILQKQQSMELGSMNLMGTSKSVWVGNLSSDIDEKTLTKVFSAYGGIESVRIVPSKKCAFVNFCRPEQASAAIQGLEGSKIGDEVIKLGYARQSSSINSSILPIGMNRRPSTGSVSFGLPNPSHIDTSLPGDPELPNTAVTNLRDIFNEGGFQSAILTPAPKAPTILSNPRSALNGTLPNVVNNGGELFSNPLGDWDIPELPLPYFGPDLSPGRIRDYRRHVESMTCKPSEFDLIAMEILPVSITASTDPVGNVLVQKLIERGSDELKGMIIAEFGLYLASIGVHKNGTWVVQKLINWCTLPEHQSQVADLLRPFIVPLMQDQYGNYVIQCCLQFEEGRNQFIMDGLSAHCFKIATSRFGSRAMRSCLESPHATAKQQKIVAASIIEQAPRFLVDPNGVIVMQWLLDSELPGKYKILLPTLEILLPTIVGMRFASNLVTKLLTQNAEPDVRDRLLDIMNRDPELPTTSMQTMLREPTCIQVISKVLTSVPSIPRLTFLDAVRNALNLMVMPGCSPHLSKLACELSESKKGVFDLSALLPTLSAYSMADDGATPSPQPVIISSKMKAHITPDFEQQNLVFGTSHQLNGNSSDSPPQFQPRSNGNTYAQP